MVFSSLSFLFCFFPAFLLVYYLTPSRPAGARNAVLLVGSCVFYVIGLDGQWAYFALLAASVLVNYGLGLAITRDKPRAKLWLIIGLCYNFLWLFLFKYLNFLLTGVNGVLGWVSGGKAAVPLLGWALPVGISFYTFSAGGYLIDVYRGTGRAGALTAYVRYVPDHVPEARLRPDRELCAAAAGVRRTRCVAAAGG